MTVHHPDRGVSPAVKSRRLLLSGSGGTRISEVGADPGEARGLAAVTAQDKNDRFAAMF